MSEPNLNSREWDMDLAEPPFRSRGTRIGRHAGAQELGATLYELDPDGAVPPDHLHHGNEELLGVLSGRPELRSPEAVRRLDPGARVSFPRGPQGAHRVWNPGPDAARGADPLDDALPGGGRASGHRVAARDDRATGGKEVRTRSDIPFMESVMRAMKAAEERSREA